MITQKPIGTAVIPTVGTAPPNTKQGEGRKPGAFSTAAMVPPADKPPKNYYSAGMNIAGNDDGMDHDQDD